MTVKEHTEFLRLSFVDDGTTLYGLPRCPRCAMLIDAVETSR